MLSIRPSSVQKLTALERHIPLFCVILAAANYVKMEDRPVLSATKMQSKESSFFILMCGL